MRLVICGLEGEGSWDGYAEDGGCCLSKYWTILDDSNVTTPANWSWMNGTVY